MRSSHVLATAGCCLLAACLIAVPRAQEVPAAARSSDLDQVLDLYVRDGFVYYRALKLERAKLDRYVNQFAAVPVGRLPRNEQVAFWLNAYNALVLQTVIDHYPIQGKSASYPPKSIRQIPGAFERLGHRVGGATLTLDQIEQTVLPQFGDPRVFLALGRGAIGSGRLRSEAFTAGSLETQLAETVGECAAASVCVQVNQAGDRLVASSIFSWREKEFTGVYTAKAPAVYAARSPIERAVIAFVEPKLLSGEREMLAKNAFRLEYLPFDWSLNDLTGRGGR